jgi:predicted aspartyl protease
MIMVADACEVGVRGQGGEVEWRSMVHHFFMRCVASAGAIRCLRRQRALESRQPSRTVVVDRIDRNSAQCARAWSQVHFSPPSNTLSQRQTMDLSRPSFYGSFRAWISVGNPSKPATIQLNASSSDGWTFMRQRFVLASLTVSFLATAANAQVPLTWDSTGHVVVPALVNGKGPYDFILDTGADESAVYAWFAKSLDLPKGESRELSGATGSEQMTVTRLSTLGVDGHVVGDIDADTVPDRSDGAKIAGIVGVDLMAHKLAVIDFACKTFALRPVEDVGADIVGKNAKLIKAGSIGGGNQLTLPVTVNGVAGTAVLDTGSRSTQINSTFAAGVGISPRPCRSPRCRFAVSQGGGPGGRASNESGA